MTAARVFRPTMTMISAAAFTVAALAGPAHAGSRRDQEVGAALAVGIGALVVGSILASKSRVDRHREAYQEPRHEPRFDQHRYRHPAPHVNQAPAREYNSGR